MTCPQCEQVLRFLAQIREAIRRFEISHAFGMIEQAAAPSPLTTVLTWIPVSERLPEDGANRLIAMESELGSRFVTEAFWDEHSEQWVYVGNNMPVSRKLKILYHAELPQPPASEETEG